MPDFEKHNYNYSAWAKERFSDVVTVSGPGTMIFLAGVGAEDENGTIGTILYPGDVLGQCRYAFDKIKRNLARHHRSEERRVGKEWRSGGWVAQWRKGEG